MGAGVLVTRVGRLLGAVLVLLGVFWAGRESGHGLAAFWEHWWCPIPLGLIVLGVASVITSHRATPAT
jgi:hypothetical protein